MVPSAATCIRWIHSWRHNRPVWTNSSDMFLDYMLNYCQCTVLNCQISRLTWQLCMPHYFLPCDVCKLHSFVAKWSIAQFSFSYQAVHNCGVSLLGTVICNRLQCATNIYYIMLSYAIWLVLLLILSGCLAKPPAEKDIKHILQESRTLKKAFETEVLCPIAECQGKNTLWFHGLVGPVGDVYSSQYKYTYIIYIYICMYIYVCICVYLFIYIYVYVCVCACVSVYIYIYLCENARNQKMCLRFGICCRNRPEGQAVTARPFKT